MIQPVISYRNVVLLPVLTALLLSQRSLLQKNPRIPKSVKMMIVAFKRGTLGPDILVLILDIFVIVTLKTCTHVVLLPVVYAMLLLLKSPAEGITVLENLKKLMSVRLLLLSLSGSKEMVSEV